jgi:hypothetical protein
MKPYLMHDTWLGALITLEVAAQFAMLSAVAIAWRTFAPQRPPRR